MELGHSLYPKQTLQKYRFFLLTKIIFEQESKSMMSLKYV